MFGRGTPVWPFSGLVIHLLEAVARVCGTPDHAKSFNKELEPYYMHWNAMEKIKPLHICPSAVFFNFLDNHVVVIRGIHISWNRSVVCAACPNLLLSGFHSAIALLQPLP